MKILGIFTFNIFIGFLFALIGLKCNSEFLELFVTQQLLPISATIIGFNISAVIFLVGCLLRFGESFPKTVKEIRENIIMMSICFFLMLLLLFAFQSSNLSENYNLGLKTIILSAFSIQVFAVYEILKTTLSLISTNE